MKVKVKGTALAGSHSETTQTDQQFEETTEAALKAVCRSQPQTYDQFMAGFTYLTPDDIKKAAAKQLQKHVKSSASGQSASIAAVEPVAASAEKTTPDSIPRDVDSFEEVLEKGTVAKSYLMRSDEQTKNMKVKVGNFIDDDDDNFADDISDDACYQPSFSKHAEKQSEVGTHLNSSLDKPAAIIVAPSNSAQISHNEEPIETTLTVDDVANAMTSSARNNRCDSEENLLDLIGADDNQSDCSSDLEYDADLDLPNPGEIVEEEDGLVRDFVTKLSFTARVGDPRSAQDVATAASDDKQSAAYANSSVEAFCLDSDFDYDNVILSPKFNEAEMAILLQAMKPSSHEQMTSGKA